MAEFHKKESEELEKEHDKLYELLEEDKKKVCLNNLLIETADLLLTVQLFIGT